MPGMWWMVTAALIVALVAAYLIWTAGRVERLHIRAESAERALEAHLVRRAAAAAVLDEERYGVELHAAALIALDAAPQDREAAENDLTRQLRDADLDPRDPAVRTVVAASRRLTLARQVHTDLVRDALTARRRRLVRLLRMDRGYERPRYFDVDDPGLHLPGEPAGS
ncbi:hypothetical protein [Melissospora conviva]|uniref:hypothetical protein n=1 Tax=Melissospora conviva TaxID=3388432 RepID=UPI003B793267